MVVCALAAACALDWRVRPDDGPGPADAASPDATAEIDAGEAGSPVREAGTDATDRPDGETCTALTADVARTRKDARRCVVSSGQCTTTMKDQCDCDVVVAATGSAEAIAYESAVAALRGSGCALGCGAAGTCPATTPRSCIFILGEQTCTP